MVPWLVIKLEVGSCSLFFYPRLDIPVYIAPSALSFYCYLAVSSLCESIRDKSQRGLTAGSLMPTFISAKTKTEAMDFDVELV